MQSRAQVKSISGGAAIFDAGRLGAALESEWFEVDYWRARGPVEQPAGGRGAAFIVRTPAGAAVLRHYRRGGLMARWNPDRYLWQGEHRTRPFLEFESLATMVAEDLPVPAPLAARYLRSGLWYRADLITLAIEDSCTLAQCLASAPSSIDWASIGTTIGRFHALGWYHADLNAHNLLLRGSQWHLIDFDRAQRLRPALDWQQANLTRLRRSLEKLGAAERIVQFDRVAWPALMRAHAQRTERDT